jgi:outer membrane protein TolC
MNDPVGPRLRIVRLVTAPWRRFEAEAKSTYIPETEYSVRAGSRVFGLTACILTWVLRSGAAAGQEKVMPIAPRAPLKLTLERALQMAEAANARLPLAADQVAIARSGIRAARARLYPGFSLDGDVHDGSPSTYASGDGRLQIAAAGTLYAGGALRAGQRVARLQYHSADAAYRVTRRDVDLEVRTRFTEALRYQREVVVRSEGIVRLRSYVIWLQARQAAGQGVAADLLSARTRVVSEEANIAEAERQLDEAEVELNDLMGRDPRAEIDLVALPEPAPPSPAEDEPWLQTPDVQQAGFDSAAALQMVTIARAGRRPFVWASANAGWEPNWGPRDALLNTGSGRGVEAEVGVTLPILDFGGYRARLEQAELGARMARDSLVLVKRQARLNWARAAANVEDLFRVYELNAESVPIARDSYLQAESTYRGGAGTAVAVLDAYTYWIEAGIAQADAAMRYRQAEAEQIRWGTP